METKEEATVPTAGSMEAKNKQIFCTSDEELKAFYLKEATLYASTTYDTQNCDEYHLLCTLKNRYKRAADFLNRLNSNSWALNIPNLHEVLMSYVFDTTVSKKKRKAVSEELTEHIRFLSILLGGQSVSKQMFWFCNENYNALKQLIKVYYPDRTEATEEVAECI